MFNSEGLGSDLQWAEGIDHDGKFFSFCLSDASFISPGVRAVWNASGMQRNVAAIYARTTHEISLYVVKNFIGIDV